MRVCVCGCGTSGGGLDGEKAADEELYLDGNHTMSFCALLKQHVRKKEGSLARRLKSAYC